MKTIKIFAIFLVLVLFSKCATTQFEQNPPFVITSAVYNNWSGETSANKGMTVNIAYTSKYVMKFDSIYFFKRAEKLTMTKVKDKKMISANFASSLKQDVILHKDSGKEINNKLPNATKLPFELKQNEAIISYKIKDKTKYYKIKAIKKGKKIIYNQTPKQ